MKNIVIIGAGGVGREVASLIKQINSKKETWNIIGFVDDNEDYIGKFVNGVRVLGKIDYLNSVDKEVNVVCAIADYKTKKRIVENIKNSNVKCVNIIHPDVYIDNTISLGEGIIIYEGAVITTNVVLNDHVIVSPKCGIGHDTEIGKYTSLLWNVNIGGNVKIGEGCLLGTGSSVIQNIKIGENMVVGAGAVVVKELPANCIAVGVPAKVIKTYDLVNVV